MTCQKAYARTTAQLMGKLPSSRVTPAPPFTHTGADFAGPFLLKKGHTRKPVKVKGYVCLFVCMTTKATHLELVMDLTSEAFIAALKRFVARRGCPTTLSTDNGTNFIGAQRELAEFYQLISSKAVQNATDRFCTAQEINWTHSPARSPHIGGLWEAAVRSMKTLLTKSVGTHLLSVEELYSILAEVEAVLNSRPLIPLESAPADGIQVLTPGHFLVGRPLRALPAPDLSQRKIAHLRCWNLCQRLTADLWERWSRDYLQQLQCFSKWRRPQKSLQVGDVILLSSLRDPGLLHRS